MREDDLVRREIEVDPHRPGPANVLLRRSGVHVWAIVGHYLYAVGKDKRAVARDYDLSLEEVDAAFAYYRRHRREIDGRIADNEPAPVG
jgi:uncharacterized protein (DUF433 family)